MVAPEGPLTVRERTRSRASLRIDDESGEAIERALNGNPVTQGAVGVGEASGFNELVSGVVAIAGIGQSSWCRAAEHVAVGIEGDSRSVHGRNPVIGIVGGRKGGRHVEGLNGRCRISSPLLRTSIRSRRALGSTD